jgi:hypothetical protein
VHSVSDVRQLEIHTAELLAPGPSHLQVEITTTKLEKYKSQVVIKFWQNWFMQEVKDSIWNKEELPDQWKECIIVPIYKKGDKTD